MKNYYFTEQEITELSQEQLDALDAEYWFEKWKMEQEINQTQNQ